MEDPPILITTNNVDVDPASCGMQQKSNITLSIVAQRSQSLASSLLVNLLISLSKIWHWFQQLFSESSFTNSSTPTTAEAEETESIITFESNLKIDNTEIIKTDQDTPDKMTIEVSGFTEAIVNPDEHGLNHTEETSESEDNSTTTRMMKYSLPMSLRLNSDSIEVEDDELLLEFNQEESSSQNGSNPVGEDSCSGYCSGSGCSLPSSPIPNVLKEPSEDGDDEKDFGETEKDLDLETGHTLNRRDSSDTSDSSVNGDNNEPAEVTPEVISRIVAQVETMFSDDHLSKDGFLLKHVRRRSDGFVSLKLVAGLRKVKQISREFPVVLTSLKKSDKLEVNPEGTKIRRKEPLTTSLKSMPIKQAKKEKSQNDNKSQAEKENQQVGSSGNNHQVSSNTSGNSTDEQQIAARRRRRGDKLNELQSERSNNGAKATGRKSIGGEDCPQVLRRRGGSLPITTQHRGSISGNFLYPNVSPPNGGFLRPKSNSYSEGTDPSAATMSSWLQRRKASASSRLSIGDISLSGVIRQPRGPDGTKGFLPGYRALIVTS